jgi:nitrite reductase/ring-hydroxylating ferredoxin subunit
MTDHVVARADELDEGERILVEIEGREIAVFNVNDEFFSHLNWCPHQGGPVCEGKVDGTTRATFDRDTLEYELKWVKDDEILMCPWHYYEFDLLTGESRHNDAYDLMSFPVRVEDDDIVVTL